MQEFIIISYLYCFLKILDLLGPKTEADLAPPPKAEKKPKGDAGKKAKKPDDRGNYIIMN